MNEVLESIYSIFFCLDTKEAKNHGCKFLAKNIIRIAMEIKLSRYDYRNFECGIKQKFPFNAILVHSFYANNLRP